MPIEPPPKRSTISKRLPSGPPTTSPCCRVASRSTEPGVVPEASSEALVSLPRRAAAIFAQRVILRPVVKRNGGQGFVVAPVPVISGRTHGSTDILAVPPGECNR